MTLALMTAAPLASALLLVLIGSRAGRAVAATVGFGGLVLALGASAAIGQAFVAGKSSLVAEIGPWIPIRGASLALAVDSRVVPFLIAACAIGAIIGLCAVVTLRRDPRAARFFIALDLLVGSLLLVLAARDLVLLLAGWVLAGVATYLLLAHERDRPEASAAASRAFVLARGSDAVLTVALLALLAQLQTVDLAQIGARLDATTPVRSADSILAASLLVVIAALVRAAQVPFHSWLPDRTHAPAVSVAATWALASLAGPFLFMRLGALLDPEALVLAVVVGMVSAVFAVLAAIGGRDRERWLTTAQLGLVIVALGVGSPLLLPLVIGTAVTRGAVALIVSRTPRVARVVSLGGLLAVAAIVASASPSLPLVVGAVVIALLAVTDAVRDIVGESPALAPAARAAVVLRAIDGRIEPWIVARLNVAAKVVDQGGDLAIAGPTELLIRACVRVGDVVDRFQRSTVWAHEALLLAAAAAIVVYWIVR
jgi:NADH:ubiquinone oxidoreductase subunit 5 (subunit L)/multisubunit Na+/H+ antiporter MnhA subunit